MVIHLLDNIEDLTTYCGASLHDMGVAATSDFDVYDCDDCKMEAE